MMCHFSIVQVHFVFRSLNFIELFPYLIKMLTNYVYYYCILFRYIVRPSGLLSFDPASLLIVFVSVSYYKTLVA